MPIPERLLAHEVTIVRPVISTDRYGNTVLDYAAGQRTTVRAWLEQASRSEPITDGRAPLVGTWRLLLNHQDVQGRDRVEWTAPSGVTVVFEVTGPPAVVSTPAGPHHVEATLQEVHG